MKKLALPAAFIAGVIVTLICSAADEVDPGNQGVIIGLRNQVTRLANELNSAKSDLAHTQAQLNETLPYFEKARSLPIKIETRKALTDDTIVLRLEESQAPLPVRITFSNATFGAKSFNRILKPCEPWTEIGTREGWKGEKGDSVFISSDGYDVKAGSL